MVFQFYMFGDFLNPTLYLATPIWRGILGGDAELDLKDAISTLKSVSPPPLLASSSLVKTPFHIIVGSLIGLESDKSHNNIPSPSCYGSI